MIEKLIDWNKSIEQIPVEWKDSQGYGVKIAILDTGVFGNHEDLAQSIVNYEDFTLVNDKIDYDGHGTHVAGIIGGRSNKSYGVIGVAPQSELIILKVINDEKDGSNSNYQNIISALDKAVSLGADIINMSFSLKHGNSQQEDELLKVNAIKDKIAEVGRKNIIMVGAAGDKADLDDKQIFFPAICNEVISVAAINEGYFIRHPNYNTKLNIVGPYVDYMSTYKGQTYYMSQPGCSMTTAFICGIISLAISYMRKVSSDKLFTKSEILSMLEKYSLSLDKINYTNNKLFNYHVNNPF